MISVLIYFEIGRKLVIKFLVNGSKKIGSNKATGETRDGLKFPDL